jgi:hypothetical protein
MPDVFVSYSRKDSDFVKRLVEAFKTEKLDVWVDFEDIPFATDWWEEIVSGIDSSQTAIFVLSPDSVQSQVCSLEVNHMFKTKKRVIPIVARDEELYKADDDSFKVSQEIRKLNWIFFNQPEEFDKAYQKLRETMTTDIEALREHTKLLVMAREWEKKGRDDSFLLRGEELRELQNMLVRTDLSDVQRDYLLLSQAKNHLNQMVQRFAWGFVGGVLGMAYYVFVSLSGVNFLEDATPIALAIAAGEVFGVAVGILGVLAYRLPDFLARWIPPSLRLPFRVVVALIAGTVCWVIYQWFFLRLGIGVSVSKILAGVGMAFGFIVPMFVNISATAQYILTAISIFLPILLLNGNSSFAPIADGSLNPLIYFRDDTQVWTVGLPMALLMALGAARPGLTRWLVTQWRKVFGKKKQDELVKAQA